MKALSPLRRQFLWLFLPWALLVCAAAALIHSVAAQRAALEDPHPTRLRELEQDYLVFCAAKGVYDQIRWIDESGRERVRVDYHDGRPAAVAPPRLQNKRQRYYFSDALKLCAGEVYVSPLDLNIEQDKIEQPFKPMIRAATPVFDSRGRRGGIVILN